MAGYIPGLLPSSHSQEKEFVQAYEDVLERYKDERDRVQKKTFTKWVNKHLIKVRKHITDLYEDLRDGHNLISLLEVLSGVTLPREKGRMRFHRLQNIQIALDFLRQRQVKLVNIRNDDITDGNPKLTLGLIWTIILHFQISEIYVSGESGDMTAKEKLLLWTQKLTEGYPGVKCSNFTSSWSDGHMFNAILHRYRPDLIDMSRVIQQSNRENLEQAFAIAESLGVTRLLDPEDVDVPSPDEKSVITYVSSIYDAFPKVPEGGQGIGAHEVDQKWTEYQNRISILFQWIRQETSRMTDKSLPQNPVELKALYNEYVHFKETEIPLKEMEKAEVEQLYKMLEVWMEFGRIKLPQGLHPNDLEEEWGKLILEMLEREKALRPAVERLELLLQIANKIQNGALNCEEKLTLAKNTLQADVSQLEAGLSSQYEQDVEMYLQDSDVMIRQLQADTHILRAERYYQVEQLAFRITCLQEELVVLRRDSANLYRKDHFASSTTSLKNELQVPGHFKLETRSLTRRAETTLGSSESWLWKPLSRTELLAISSSEDEGNLRFAYELLSWVEETQVKLERAEWGTDLPSVEKQLEAHHLVHCTVEELQDNLREARLYESKISPGLQSSYSETLSKLENQYCKLLETSSSRLQSLRSLHAFVRQATSVLIWLNEREEEEMAFDLSEQNPNIGLKKGYFTDLKAELEQKQLIVCTLEDTAKRLSLENHPAKQTMEAYNTAAQTQWQWVYHLCDCIEQHIRDNMAYFQFFNEVQESESFLIRLQDSIRRKYTCDCKSRLSRLEDLLQDSMDEKEQLIQYKSSVASLVGRAKFIVQLKPRNPDYAVDAAIPIRAMCDYRQIEITINMSDECVLVDNSQRTKWKVISPTGNEAMVPSVCFGIPPPNQDALDKANRIEQLYQNAMTVWHQFHVNMKSIISWNYLVTDIKNIMAWNLDTVKSQTPSERQQALDKMASHLSDFLDDSRESNIFTVSDQRQLENDVEKCRVHSKKLEESMEIEEKDAEILHSYLSELQSIQMKIEQTDQRLCKGIRGLPANITRGKDITHESSILVAEQERIHQEVDILKSEINFISQKCSSFLENSPSSAGIPSLRSELSLTVTKIGRLYSLSLIYLNKLKTLDVLIHSCHAAESLVKKYEDKLNDEETVQADLSAIKNQRDQLQLWILETCDKQSIFSALEGVLLKSKCDEEQPLPHLNQEKNLDLERYREQAIQLKERWNSVNLQIRNRQSDLENLEKILKDYRECHKNLISWIEKTSLHQEEMQPGKAEDSKILSEQLNQQTALVVEIEKNQTMLDECQNLSKQYCSCVKDYELQLMTYRAFVESHQKSPVKKRRMKSLSDAISQEFMDLHTRYTALVTLTTQHVKYINDALRRLQEEEKLIEEEKLKLMNQLSEMLSWTTEMKKNLLWKENFSGIDGSGMLETVLSEQQAISIELASRKDQVSEITRTVQFFLQSKKANKLSSDEKQEITTQVDILTEIYRQLCEQSMQNLQQLHVLLAEKAKHKERTTMVDLETIEVFSKMLLEAQLVLCGNKNVLFDKALDKNILHFRTNEPLMELQGALDLLDTLCDSIDSVMRERYLSSLPFRTNLEQNEAGDQTISSVEAANPFKVDPQLELGILKSQMDSGDNEIVTEKAVNFVSVFQLLFSEEILKPTSTSQLSDCDIVKYNTEHNMLYIGKAKTKILFLLNMANDFLNNLRKHKTPPYVTEQVNAEEICSLEETDQFHNSSNTAGMNGTMKNDVSPLESFSYLDISNKRKLEVSTMMPSKAAKNLKQNNCMLLDYIPVKSEVTLVKMNSTQGDTKIFRTNECVRHTGINCKTVSLQNMHECMSLRKKKTSVPKDGNASHNVQLYSAIYMGNSNKMFLPSVIGTGNVHHETVNESRRDEKVDKKQHDQMPQLQYTTKSTDSKVDNVKTSKMIIEKIVLDHQAIVPVDEFLSGWKDATLELFSEIEEMGNVARLVKDSTIPFSSEVIVEDSVADLGDKAALFMQKRVEIEYVSAGEFCENVILLPLKMPGKHFAEKERRASIGYEIEKSGKSTAQLSMEEPLDYWTGETEKKMNQFTSKTFLVQSNADMCGIQPVPLSLQTLSVKRCALAKRDKNSSHNIKGNAGAYLFELATSEWLPGDLYVTPFLKVCAQPQGKDQEALQQQIKVMNGATNQIEDQDAALTRELKTQRKKAEKNEYFAHILNTENLSQLKKLNKQVKKVKNLSQEQHPLNVNVMPCENSRKSGTVSTFLQCQNISFDAVATYKYLFDRWIRDYRIVASIGEMHNIQEHNSVLGISTIQGLEPDKCEVLSRYLEISNLEELLQSPKVKCVESGELISQFPAKIKKRVKVMKDTEIVDCYNQLIKVDILSQKYCQSSVFPDGKPPLSMPNIMTLEDQALADLALTNKCDYLSFSKENNLHDLNKCMKISTVKHFPSHQDFLSQHKKMTGISRGKGSEKPLDQDNLEGQTPITCLLLKNRDTFKGWTLHADLNTYLQESSLKFEAKAVLSLKAQESIEEKTNDMRVVKKQDTQEWEEMHKAQRNAQFLFDISSNIDGHTFIPTNGEKCDNHSLTTELTLPYMMKDSIIRPGTTEYFFGQKLSISKPDLNMLDIYSELEKNGSSMQDEPNIEEYFTRIKNAHGISTAETEIPDAAILIENAQTEYNNNKHRLEREVESPNENVNSATELRKKEVDTIKHVEKETDSLFFNLKQFKTYSSFLNDKKHYDRDSIEIHDKPITLEEIPAAQEPLFQTSYEIPHVSGQSQQTESSFQLGTESKAVLLEKIKNKLHFHNEMKENQEKCVSSEKLYGNYRGWRQKRYDEQLSCKNEEAKYTKSTEANQSTAIHPAKEYLVDSVEVLDVIRMVIQLFISEHNQDLKPHLIGHLLGQMNQLQTSFFLKTEMVQEQQEVYSQKLDKLGLWLEKTSSSLAMYQEAKIDSDLNNLHLRQASIQAFQHDIKTNAADVSEVIASVKAFLSENGDFLPLTEHREMEKKLEQAEKQYAELVNCINTTQQIIDSAVATAQQNESQKVKVMTTLKETRCKVDQLLGLVSSLPSPSEAEGEIQQSETDSLLQPEVGIDSQYKRIMAYHQVLLSQQQSIIMTTKSAQAFLDRQTANLPSEECQQLSDDLAQLSKQYESQLAKCELQLRQMQMFKEEQIKFLQEHTEFVNWLEQSENGICSLNVNIENVKDLQEILEKQKLHSDDIICHKADLRFVTISGQKVLDMVALIHTSGWTELDILSAVQLVKNKMDDSTERYSKLRDKCLDLGVNLNNLLQRYYEFKDEASSLDTWLQKHQRTSEGLLSDSTDLNSLQKQLDTAKKLQDEFAEQQLQVQHLKQATNILLNIEPNMSKEEILKTTEKLVENFENLFQTISQRSEKLQTALAQSQGVQKNLLGLHTWMDSVEEMMKTQENITPSAQAVRDALTQNQKVRHDLLSHQGSMEAVQDLVTQILQTTDALTASRLQTDLCQLHKRFTLAKSTQQQKELSLMEVLNKLVVFETLAMHIKQFIESSNEVLVFGNPLDRELEDCLLRFVELKKTAKKESENVCSLRNLAAELSTTGVLNCSDPLQDTVKQLTEEFNKLEVSVEERCKEVSHCRQRLEAFHVLVTSLQNWLHEMQDKLPDAELHFTTKELEIQVHQLNEMLSDWESQKRFIKDMNQMGSELEGLIVKIMLSRSQLKHDMTQTQCEMSEVNSAYKSLGVSLKERLDHFSSSLGQRQHIEQEAASVTHFLEIKEQSILVHRQQGISPSKQLALQQQAEQNKVLQAELDQHSAELDNLKKALFDIIEKNSTSPEAKKWKIWLDDIDARWKRTNELVSERQALLEGSVNLLQSFTTAESQLRPWLAEKQLMISVLGPLSIEPNMLRTQKQQVQFLLKEFDSRRTQFDQLTHSGESIMSSDADPNSVSCSTVRDQLSSVTVLWKNLTDCLNLRFEQIDQAQEMSSKYQNVLQDLSCSLAQLGQRLDENINLSIEPSLLQEQLEENSRIHSELERSKKNLDEAESLFQGLTNIIVEEYLREELIKRLENVSNTYKTLCERAAKCLLQLQCALSSSQQFKQTFDEFCNWLEQRSEEAEGFSPVSGHLRILRTQLQQQEDFQKHLNQHRGTYDLILSQRDSFLLSMSQGEERTVLQTKVGLLKKRWEKLNCTTAKRQELLKDCITRALRYQQHLDELLPWIKNYEVHLSKLNAIQDPAKLEEALLTAKSLGQETEKQRVLLELFNATSDSLIEACESGEDEIRDEKAVVNQKMDALSEEMLKITTSLEEKYVRIKELHDGIREVKLKLEISQHKLEIHEALGLHSCSSKSLEKIQTQLEVLQSLDSQIHYLKDLIKGLQEDATLGRQVTFDCTELSAEVEDIASKTTVVKHKVEECCIYLEERLLGVGQMQARVRDLFSQIADLDDELDSMSPISRDQDSLQSQVEDLHCFLSQLSEMCFAVNECSTECCRKLESEGNTPDLLAIKKELDTLTRQSVKLNERAKCRLDQVEITSQRVKEFYNIVKDLSGLLVAAEMGMTSQGSVSSELETINQQLAMLKLFQKEQVDPIQPPLQHLNNVGQGLIQSAAKNSDTQGLEHDLEEINMRWNTLNKKVSERIAHMQEALLHCGKFQDALEPLLSWLTETEDLIANQKPPSVEYKVVKAQIQEQKLLQRLLDDHKLSVEMISAEGQRIAQSTEPFDQEKICRQLQTLSERWSAVISKANNRQCQLDDLLILAKRFHDIVEPLIEWLSTTEKKLANSEPLGTQTSKILQQINQHKALNEEILDQKKNVDQAIKNGQALLCEATGEEVTLILEKLDGIKSHYSEITATSSRALRILEQALQLSTRFRTAYEELGNWMDNVESELASSTGQLSSTELISHFQERQRELKTAVTDQWLVLDTVNEVSSALLELVPWRARDGLDRLVVEANERFKSISDIISQRVEQIDAAIQRSLQYEQNADAELAWAAETERKLTSLGLICLEQDQTMAQLQVQKAFTIDIIRHKDSIDKLLEDQENVLEMCKEEQKVILKNKTESLLKQYDLVSQLNSERYGHLEKAQVLVNQFWETLEEVNPWLEETLSLIVHLPSPAVHSAGLRQQQDDLRQLREFIAERKSYIDRLIKIGPQLAELNPVEGDVVLKRVATTESCYRELKEEVKQRAMALEEAETQLCQFHDKIEPMLETLQLMQSRLCQPPAIPAEVDKIREQIADNKNISAELDKLLPSFQTLSQKGGELIRRSQGLEKESAVKSIKKQLDMLSFYFEDIKSKSEEREAKLLDVLDLAEKFWYDMTALLTTIRDTQDIVRDLEDPGIDPSLIKQQIEAAEAIKAETDGLLEELEFVRNLGGDLIISCGETEKPEVKKTIDEMNQSWESLNRTWKERMEHLAEAMSIAVQYQDAIQAMYDYLDNAVIKLCDMSSVGTDIDTVKQQIDELKVFKEEVYQQQIDMEKLNHQGELMLKKAADDTDRDIIQEPLTELKHLWDNLGDKIVLRQHKLETALLALGQFHHALSELMSWLTHTAEMLDCQRPVSMDPKSIEIELAKHHVLRNDVLSHHSTVDSVNKAGNELLQSSEGDEASHLHSSLNSMNCSWEAILLKTQERQQHLEAALQQAEGFHGEVEDFLQWLRKMESQLYISKPTGGLPETAKEQLQQHMDIKAQFSTKEELYQQIMDKGHHIIINQDDPAVGSNTKTNLALLEQKWQALNTKIEERRDKLEEALCLATEFQSSLQDFINWLTQAEQNLNLCQPPSFIQETVLLQVDEHKQFVNEVNTHRDQIMCLDKMGSHLKFTSQKQDVVLIRNLLMSMQSRWEKVVQRSLERGRSLDEVRKRGKQFSETWRKLVDWLEEAERQLDSELEISNDPDKIKLQLTKHKEFQKILGAKQPVYDTTVRSCRSMKEKAPLSDDLPKLDNLLGEVRDKWDTVCGKSVERQHKLEEALLFSGQFADALQALIDWLCRVEPQLSEDQQVHGDLDLVINLMDAHKVFQKELGKRTSSMQALKRSARELIESGRDDTTWVKVQLLELTNRWDIVCKLSVSKQSRLEHALKQAEEFRSAVNHLLEWLSEAEQTLRFRGVLPDEVETLQSLISLHKEFMTKVEEKQIDVNAAVEMGEAILVMCHHDSITTIKHWITIIRARFEEVQTWTKQHQQRLENALAELMNNAELLEQLLSWLQWAETTLIQRDQELLPQNIDQVKGLITEHQSFMEEMTRKQPDVDKVTKTYKRKANDSSQDKSQTRKFFSRGILVVLPPNTQAETKNPKLTQLSARWQQVWLLALDRQRKLNDALDRLEELKEFANFDFDMWRKKYMRWMNHKKSRVMDFFRRIDKDQDGKITRQEFIDGILSSKFPTTKLEMSAVADIFDRDGDGYIDYYEFVAALHPNKDAYRPTTDADKIEDEVTRQVAQCKCAKRFQVEQIGENKYRFFLGNQFGDSQQLRLVRILRSTVMVRVGGGWMALDEFLVKNDPCRVTATAGYFCCRARGRTNLELREKFILPEGASQGMTPFRSRGRRSKPSSRTASPTRSSSSASQSNHSCTSVPSSPVTPASSSRVVSASKSKRTTFHSNRGNLPGENENQPTPSSAKSKYSESKRTPSSTSHPTSRGGSQAGSRASSRRGSDASDFDLLETQSACSDISETSTSGVPRKGMKNLSKIPTITKKTASSSSSSSATASPKTSGNKR
ncbi:microtubule-actin cross-linking factor 1, isoforms 1/2/3/5 isoform X3 [Polypterus senegalus]|uniref:microtubule-actin cross-linking factor 1, isoforms 1/2/3/5 isoform X3 n=1 Tax=Polypterus senegalus TaxID=55291 RepID=UPI0019623BA0|nr:microtubule-actin cross-linking factor 1, isoforms 1/2/3/5 isoform X3 [Polypterus senegalus]